MSSRASEKPKSGPGRSLGDPPDAFDRATIRPPHSGAEEPIAFDRLVPTLRTPVSVPLGRLETTVFMRIDSRRSVLDISQEVGLTPLEVLRILERLVHLVPDLKLVEPEVVELSVDDLAVDELWEEEELPATTAEVPGRSEE